MSKRVIRVKRAPEPSDVKWENCGISFSTKLFRRIITAILTIVVLGIGFAGLYYVAILKVINHKH